VSVLVNRETRVVVQGITGRHGTAFSRVMLDSGTNVVAGVTPGKRGGEVHGVPVFDTVREAAEATGANASVVFVPVPHCREALYEAIEAQLGVVACITDGLPVQDMMLVKRRLVGGGSRAAPTVLVGPNCPGLITPGEANVGIMPFRCFTPGSVGVVTRSGTLTYQTAAQLSARGIGQSTCIGIGGDPIVGLSFAEALELFEADPATELVVLVGEIGGTQEERAAAFVAWGMSKPVVAFVAGQTSPPGKPMGHAGAIVTGTEGSYESKVAAFERAGVPVAPLVTDIVPLVERSLKRG
jgi:succinyl-CoA synthetase alpha subunit